MAAPPAVVQQLRFEVSTTDAALGRQLGDRLSQLFHHTLQRVLDEELARHAPADTLLQLPHLVLELPPVASHRFEQELPALLRAALRSALAGIAAPAQTTVEAAPLAALRHFLLHGQLPWQATAGNFEPNRAIGEALRLHPGGLRDLLRQLGGLRPPRQRLAGQLSLLTLGRLIDFLEPVHAPLIRAYLHETLAAHRRQPLVSASDSALQQVVYELVLADLLSTWHTQFNRRGFVERQLRQLAAHYNLGYEVLLRQLVATLPVRVTGSALAPTLPGIIQTLYRQEQEGGPAAFVADAPRRQHNVWSQNNQPENEYITPSRNPTASVADTLPQAFSAQTPAAGRYAALQYFLRHESLPLTWNQAFSQADLLAELLAIVRGRRPALLRLAQAAGPATMARTLLHHFPGLSWQELVRTLAPGQARPILALAEEMVRQDKSLSIRNHPATQQQILHYLLTEASPLAGVPGLRRWLARQPALPSVSGVAAKTSGRAVTPWRSSPVASEAEQWNRPLASRLATSRNVDASRHFTDAALSTHHEPNNPQSTGIPQRLLDYLLLGLSTQHGVATISPAQLRRWLQDALNSPTARAELLDFLRQHYRDQPVLRHLAALAGTGELARLLPGRASELRPPGPLAALLTTTASTKRQQLLREAYLLFHLRPHWEQTAPGTAAGRKLAAAYHLPSQALHEALRRQLLAVPALAASRFFRWLLAGLAPDVTSNQFEANTLRLSPQQPTSTFGTAAGGFTHAPAAALGALRQITGDRLLWQLSPVGGRQLPARQLRPTWATQPAEARELVFTYLLRGTAPQHISWLKPLLRWIATTQTADFKAFLRQYATIGPLWQRLAGLADFATLSHLEPGHRSKRRAFPGAFDALATRPAGSTGLLQLLKTTWLTFHYRPDIAFSTITVRQLLAAQSLPLRATLTRLTQLGQKWPILAAAPFFIRLLARLREASQPANPALDRSKLNPSAEFNSPANTSIPPAQPSAQPDIPLARQDLLLHYLRHGQAPWWHAAPLPAETLSQTLRQLARHPRPLRELLRPHLHEAAVQRHLAQVADFSLLHELVPPPGLGRSQRQQLRPALAALDRRLRQSATGQERFRLFLRQAYLAFATSSAPASSQPLAGARRLAGASGLSWRGVLLRIGSLLRQHPALAADPFFGALLRAFVALTRPARPLKQPDASRILSPAPAVSALLPVSPMQAETAWQQLEHYLQTGDSTPGGPPAPALALLLQPGHTALLSRVGLYAGQPAAQSRLAAIVGSELFFRLLHQLFPVTYQLTANIVRDWLRLQAAGIVQTGPTALTELWRVALAVASTSSNTQPAALVQLLLQAESAARPQPVTGPQLAQTIARQRLVLRSPLAALLVALPAPSAPANRLAKPVKKPTPSPRKPAPTTLRPKPLPPEPLTEAAYISNAGLVLLWPFFTMLFDRLSYLEEKQFRNPEMAERAAHLLQFLVSGGMEFPEHLLLLNKLLCGIDPARPLARAVPLTPEEQSTGEGLLGAALGRWDALKNTSIAGLRETFLQRPGKLIRGDDRLTLTVETKTVDILLDRLPWSFALIKLPWMPLPLYVTWR